MADSFYGGTWASGGLPEEIVTFEMCQEFKCSPKAYRTEFTAYERRVFADLLYAKRLGEQERHEREARRGGS